MLKHNKALIPFVLFKRKNKKRKIRILMPFHNKQLSLNNSFFFISVQLFLPYQGNVKER